MREKIRYSVINESTYVPVHVDQRRCPASALGGELWCNAYLFWVVCLCTHEGMAYGRLVGCIIIEAFGGKSVFDDLIVGKILLLYSSNL